MWVSGAEGKYPSQTGLHCQGLLYNIPGAQGPDAMGLGPGPANDEGREHRNLPEPTHIKHLYDRYPTKGFIVVTY